MDIFDNIWERIVKRAKDIDSWRKFHMAFAEWFDAWRLMPRMIVVGYSYVCWKAFIWYINLEPKVIEGCDIELLKEACITQEPSTQHMAFITALFGISAGIFAFYTTTGKKWNGFTPWNVENLEEKQKALAPKLEGGRRASDPPT